MGSGELSEVFEHAGDFTRAYDSATGVYSLTIHHAFFAGFVSQITCFRFCAQVSASAIDASFFDDCALTINEEMAS